MKGFIEGLAVFFIITTIISLLVLVNIGNYNKSQNYPVDYANIVLMENLAERWELQPLLSEMKSDGNIVRKEKDEFYHVLNEKVLLDATK